MSHLFLVALKLRVLLTSVRLVVLDCIKIRSPSAIPFSCLIRQLRENFECCTFFWGLKLIEPPSGSVSDKQRLGEERGILFDFLPHSIPLIRRKPPQFFRTRIQSTGNQVNSDVAIIVRNFLVSESILDLLFQLL